MFAYVIFIWGIVIKLFKNQWITNTKTKFLTYRKDLWSCPWTRGLTWSCLESWAPLSENNWLDCICICICTCICISFCFWISICIFIHICISFCNCVFVPEPNLVLSWESLSEKNCLVCSPTHQPTNYTTQHCQATYQVKESCFLLVFHFFSQNVFPSRSCGHDIEWPLAFLS